MLKNVLVNLINNIMLLNKFNKKKEKLIWKKYKLVYKYKIYLMLFNNMISIIDKIKIN